MHKFIFIAVLLLCSESFANVCFVNVRGISSCDVNVARKQVAPSTSLEMLLFNDEYIWLTKIVSAHNASKGIKDVDINYHYRFDGNGYSIGRSPCKLYSSINTNNKILSFDDPSLLFDGTSQVAACGANLDNFKILINNKWYQIDEPD